MKLIKLIPIIAFGLFCGLFGWQFAPAGSGVEPFINKPLPAKAQVYKVTAYCPCEKCCGRFADGITASGYKIQAGDRFVAADPSLPFRTMLIIPGYNNDRPVPVLDRGGAIKGNRIDVFFDTHYEALWWGVKYLEI